jgi:hypothetical protein
MMSERRLLWPDLPVGPLNPVVGTFRPTWDIENDLGHFQLIDPVAKHELLLTGEIGVLYGYTIIPHETTPFDIYRMRRYARTLNRRKKRARARTGRR